MKLNDLPTPVYVIDEQKLIKNLKVLQGVQRRAGCKILLAQKAFSCFHFYKLIGGYLAGAASSGLYEARLAHEEMGGENCVFSPAYLKEEFSELDEICTHIVFNSVSEVFKFAPLAKKAQPGLRLNPQFSTQKSAIYDPCAFGSRLGVTKEQFDERVLKHISGFHMHTLCEQGAEELAATVRALEERFGKYLALPSIRWLNLGGGHLITKEGYNLPLLEEVITSLRKKYDLEIYLEPGEAIALNAGHLYTRVLGFVNNGITTAILDCSAECHMPDVIEMPYMPPLYGAKGAGELAHTYRLSSRTCLAGDVIGDYSFCRPLEEGDLLRFDDMAIYTMVKNNTFNGMPLPAIAKKTGEEYELIKSFDYSDFKGRLS